MLLAERWIMAVLRHRTFFSLGELNEAIREALLKLNQRPFQKLEGSRQSLFETLDRPALKPLPTKPYEFAVWRKARVHIDYHIEVDKIYYSVPHTLVQQEVEVRLTPSVVEIFHKGRRVASHQRGKHKGEVITIAAHRPKAHQKHLEWTPSRLIAWGTSIGANTGILVERILQSRPHPEQGFRSCLGLLSLSKSYSAERLEAASTRAIKIGACSYRSVKSILQKGYDQLPMTEPEAETPPPVHENVRGSQYFFDFETPTKHLLQ